MTETTGDSAAAAELVYLSWGGTGRAGSFRTALMEAEAQGRPVVYLAVLDDAHFADVDHDLLGLARTELDWLLQAQVDLTKRQCGCEGTDVRILIRAGVVADEVVEVLDALAAGGGGRPELVIGAPVPEVGGGAADLLAELGRRIGDEVRIVGP